LKVTAVPQEQVASIFGVDEEANQETSMKQVENRAYLTLQYEDGGDMILERITRRYIPEDNSS
jgi:hypothetical protein